MRIAAAGAGLILLALVVSSIDATRAEDEMPVDDNLDLDSEEEEDEPKEISTSLRVENTTLGRNVKLKGTISAVSGANGTSEAGVVVTAGSNATKTMDADEDRPEELPEALELRYARPVKNRRRPYYAPTRRPPVNRRNVYHQDKPVRTGSTRPTRRPVDPKRAPTESECTFFSKTVCLEAADYPIEAIMRSIRNNKDMVSALLADFKVQEAGFTGDGDGDGIPVSSSYKSSYDNRYDKRYENRFETSNEIKRKYEFNSPFENVEEGFTCPSQVKYARPQLARAASGVWKYIINTGEHTQTLRLEKCSNTQTSCSFISENYRSSCVQIYNYHRLLTWDSKLGLHMDIFKVPTCCSCHVHGYTDLFPPHQTDPPHKAQENFPGADFATSDPHIGKGSSNINKYANSLDSAALNLFRDNYGSSGSEAEETQLQHSSSSRKPSIARPPRTRKPSGAPRPFDKLPQQHAPNTRAPGYKGPRPFRQNRPFRRESAAPEVPDYSENPSNLTLNRFSQTFEQDTLEPNLRLQNGGFDEEYQETQRRINYNYHPIIDFFKPEAAMLKSEESLLTSASSAHVDHDSWKPIFKP